MYKSFPDSGDITGKFRGLPVFVAYIIILVQFSKFVFKQKSIRQKAKAIEIFFIFFGALSFLFYLLVYVRIVPFYNYPVRDMFLTLLFPIVLLIARYRLFENKFLKILLSAYFLWLPMQYLSKFFVKYTTLFLFYNMLLTTFFYVFFLYLLLILLKIMVQNVSAKDFPLRLLMVKFLRYCLITLNGIALLFELTKDFISHYNLCCAGKAGDFMSIYNSIFIPLSIQSSLGCYLVILYGLVYLLKNEITVRSQAANGEPL